MSIGFPDSEVPPPKTKNPAILQDFMELMGGFEPPTSSLPTDSPSVHQLHEKRQLQYVLLVRTVYAPTVEIRDYFGSPHILFVSWALATTKSHIHMIAGNVVRVQGVFLWGIIA